MKNYILLASAAMMVATVSCTMDLTPKGEAPASNEITFDAADLTDIRPGEVITREFDTCKIQFLMQKVL